MPTTATDDGTALLAAIEDRPDDDTPRLVFADYLDGLDTAWVECPQCGGRGSVHASGVRGSVACGLCKSEKTVIDTSNRDRAELIRSQVWLWANPACSGCTGPEWQQGKPCSECDRREALRERCRELLAANRARWERVPCVVCGGKGDQGYGTGCKDCRGTGDAGGLTRTFRYPIGEASTETEPVRVTWARGFPVATVPRLADCVEKCHRCNGDGRVGMHHDPASDTWRGGKDCPACKGEKVAPTVWLRTVTNYHRGIEVVPLDREPVPLDREPEKWIGCVAWYKQGQPWASRPASELPPGIFAILTGGEMHPSRFACEYPTRQTATLALGRALAKFGRGK